MQATASIPIVIGGVDDAVEQGFVASLRKAWWQCDRHIVA
jgi:hypothetical protein